MRERMSKQFKLPETIKNYYHNLLLGTSPTYYFKKYRKLSPQAIKIQKTKQKEENMERKLRVQAHFENEFHSMSHGNFCDTSLDTFDAMLNAAYEATGDQWLLEYSKGLEKSAEALVAKVKARGELYKANKAAEKAKEALNAAEEGIEEEDDE